MRNSQNSTLLGNLNIGKWDDDDDDDNDEMNQQIKKTADMRKFLTNKIAQEERKQKRNMYLNSWDAALDAGKVSYYFFCIYLNLSLLKINESIEIIILIEKENQRKENRRII